MAEMGIAAAASHGGAHHAEAGVTNLFDVLSG
jgi:hypothetical protein